MTVDLRRLERELAGGTQQPDRNSSVRSKAEIANQNEVDSGGRSPISAAKGRWPIVIGGSTAMLVALLIVFFLYARNETRTPPLDLQNMRLSRLAEDGKAIDAAISPDGRYVVYVLADGEKQSLWMRQVAAESSVQVLPADRVEFDGLTFSQDGNFIYLVTAGLAPEKNLAVTSLYKMPVLGGTPRQLVRDIDTAISIAPDGKRMAFVRGNPTKGESYLVIANMDGGGEKVLVTKKSPQIFTGGVFYSYTRWLDRARLVSRRANCCCISD